MKTITRGMIGLFLMALAALVVASATDDANAALDQGGLEVVETLIEIGKPSPQAAAEVIVVVVRVQPALLREVMVGLAAVMSPEDFALAVSVAANTLGNEPAELALVLGITREMASTLVMVDGQASMGSADRVGEGGRPVQDPPAGGPIGDTLDPVLGTLGPLGELLTPVIQIIEGLLGVDPPASPS